MAQYCRERESKVEERQMKEGCRGAKEAAKSWNQWWRGNQANQDVTLDAGGMIHCR